MRIDEGTTTELDDLLRFKIPASRRPAEDQDPEFDRDIRVRRRSDGQYAADLPPGWVVGAGISGGYLLVVLANAARHRLPRHPDPISVSAHYVSASRPGPAEVRVDVKRDRGSLATASAELWQDGELRLVTTGTYGDLAKIQATASPYERVTLTEPDLPPREECVSETDMPEELKAFLPAAARAEMRMPRGEAGWMFGKPDGVGTVSCWFRHHGRDADPLSLLHMIDALPPVVYGLGLMGWAPTLELTCHIRHLPAPGWVKVIQTSHNLSGGMFEQDCEVWDSAGTLVAQSRQLTRVPRA